MDNTQQQAPKITPEHVEGCIVGEAYYRFPGTTVTVCCLTLPNGFNAIGHSACVSPQNFDANVGRDIARKNAAEKIWELEGYMLASYLIAMQQMQQQGVQAVQGGGIAPTSGPLEDSTGPIAGSVEDFTAPMEQVMQDIQTTGIGIMQGDNRVDPQEVFQSGNGGDYAGAGASGSWEAPTPSADACSPASDPPAASAGDGNTDGSGI